MSELMQNLPQVAAAYMLYLVAVISPGPAIIAIISTSLNQGRQRGLTIALGIFAGSFTWAMAAALGMAALLTRYAEVLNVLKIVGGFYLLYLAYKASRGALRPTVRGDLPTIAVETSIRRTFLTGYAIHLTNPKAVFAWVAIISLGLPAGASGSAVALIVGGCLATGLTIFIGYALLFSTKRAARLYQSARRPLDALMAAMFGAAGVKMISSAF
ncbi:LysE family translocator [Allorhizobium pseudoryzae]|jgi:threonine/homoserine/homoserine lactone efflux protein|uniref:LysE family translocator n=1 Tax=Allorhizobium pseudoryzae TaxID=379684 RepID=UPI0013EC089C|nr:LysE family translocator [Allorhizobium pseudoryzae]